MLKYFKTDDQVIHEEEKLCDGCWVRMIAPTQEECAYIAEQLMVDIEDVINNEPIYSKKMLNFIIEQFNCPLEQMVWTQRLFMSIIKETLEEIGAKLTRDGDDLFFDNRKLSVSIATKSITSCLIHTGLNIIKEGAPISVSDLNEIEI